MATTTEPNANAILRQHRSAIVQLQQQIANLIAAQSSRPKTVAEEIDEIPGRRMEGTLSGEVAFTINDQFQRGAPVTMGVSQDGPFIMTHYPMVVWTPHSPTTATNLGRYRPVSTFPLPAQVVGTDIIDLGYELADGGNQRLLQNAPRGPLFSRPDNIVPCPVPTLWSPGSTVQFIPSYGKFTWDSAVPPTSGVLHVDIPGYRIVNL